MYNIYCLFCIHAHKLVSLKLACTFGKITYNSSVRFQSYLKYT